MSDKPVSNSGKYPTKPITVIVPYSAGGNTDIMVRALEKSAIKHLGQALVVTNIPGAGGTLGWNELAGAKPDGYTIGATTMVSILQPLYGQTRYHYPTALDPLVQITSTPVLAAVRADQPWNNIDELVKYAKAHPGEIKYGHPGFGTTSNVLGELFAKKTDINIAQVPFRGDSEVMAALLGGHIQLIFMPPTAMNEYVKSGKVKVLAAAAEQRLTQFGFKDVLTFKEQGLDIVFGTWQGIAAPKGLPADEKVRLVAGLTEIINDPEFIQNMQELGMDIDYLDPQEFGQKWIDETLRLKKIVQETGIVERIAAQKK